jgi:bile acid:Na+ symporter, BASS family
MIEVLRTLLAIAVLVFPLASMLSVGLGYTFREISEPLRHPQRVFRAFVANFVLVPLLALGISRLLSLDPALSAGLMLLGTAAGAPFLIQLTQVAKADMALGAALTVLLMPLTVIFMPLVVPLVVADASVSALGIAIPLILTLILPLLVGLAVKTAAPSWAARFRPIASQISTIALVVLVASTILVNSRALRGLFGTGALLAAFLLIGGAFCIGYLLASPGASRRTVLGLGTGQRNIAAALVVASQDFPDPNVLTMVVVASLVDLVVLFPIAWILRRRSARTATPPPGDASGAVMT